MKKSFQRCLLLSIFGFIKQRMAKTKVSTVISAKGDGGMLKTLLTRNKTNR